MLGAIARKSTLPWRHAQSALPAVMGLACSLPHSLLQGGLTGGSTSPHLTVCRRHASSWPPRRRSHGAFFMHGAALEQRSRHSATSYSGFGLLGAQAHTARAMSSAPAKPDQLSTSLSVATLPAGDTPSDGKQHAHAETASTTIPSDSATPEPVKKAKRTKRAAAAAAAAADDAHPEHPDALLTPKDNEKFNVVVKQTRGGRQSGTVKTLGPLDRSHKVESPPLRPYQIECIDKCLQHVADGNRRMIVSLPVGSGKTVVFANLIKQLPQPKPSAFKTLVLAHREELLVQAMHQVHKFNPHAKVGLEKAGFSAPPDCDVVVASVCTLGRDESERILRFDPNEFKLIIVDEAHHAAADTYIRVLQNMNALSPDSHIVVWGCSATVQRNDRDLKDVFDKVVYNRTIQEMWDEKWLVPIRSSRISTSVNLNAVRLRGKEFVESDLAAEINVEARNELIVNAYLAGVHGVRKSTLVFAISIDHTESLAKAFVQKGVEARAVHSQHTAEYRAESVRLFKEQKLPVLVNCGIFTEGTDIPCIDCLILARPTLSANLFTQMVGRGLRRHESKDDCLVIDVVDQLSKHSLMVVPSLVGLDSSFDAHGGNITEAAKLVNDLAAQGMPAMLATSVDQLAALCDPGDARLAAFKLLIGEVVGNVSLSESEEYDATRQLRGRMDGWFAYSLGKWYRPVPLKGYLMIQQDGLGLFHTQMRFTDRRRKPPVEEVGEPQPSLALAKKEAKIYLRDAFPDIQALLNTNGTWRKEPVTDKQMDMLSEYHPSVDTIFPRPITKGEASELISRMKVIAALERSRYATTTAKEEMARAARMQAFVRPAALRGIVDASGRG
ncbi:ATP-dependent DNA helicase [Capsaspora owczarzaki ATCC 30864]|uniref:ATP-dependent DNA helicase n=1 Tax=Capsaspora owczarzaki (strain ATCC 30864) TaxID=595528 RepID=A0A0D2VP34_CAPO3|nr:ATP-dependent DNA helicase [Capsaspora owczarzaki ATCC 30864]KJE92142.1 ATP-dependent DNA helicase [Capsaspora owczarzaki ATCC 30864]|eukprot:XP_004364001.2 ATP-dependent DNA helicase [Capsaspora owczarzaki ATCC 30864]